MVKSNPMKKTFRKITSIFLILLVISIFVGLTVLLVIIAQGGKVTPQGIEKTGIIRLNIEPDKDINVFVDGKKVDLKDKRIENLDEGDYEIVVSKEGYSSWTKTVFVEEGIVKDLYVNLFPEDLQLEQLTTTNIDKSFFSPDGNFVVYIVKNGTTEENGVWKLKLAQNTISFISNRPEKIYGIDKQLETLLNQDYQITISLNNSKFVLSTPDSQFIYGMDKGVTPIDLLDIKNVGFLPDEYKWFEDGDSLILKKDNTIYEYEIVENVVKVVHQFEDNPIYAVNGRSLVFFANGEYYKYQNSQKELLNTAIKSKLPNADRLWLSSYEDNLMYIESESTLYFVDLERSIHKIGNYELLDLAAKGRGALLFDPAEKSISLFRNEFIPAKGQIDTNITLINKKFDSTTQSYKWSSDSTHVIFSEANKVYLTDLYGANTYQVLESKQLDNSNYQLVNEASEFVVLLSDSTKDKGANLYKIALR